MVLRKYLNKMVDRERKELARRSALKKKKIIILATERKEIAKKIRSFKPKGKLSSIAYTKAIGNPYGVKLVSRRKTKRYKSKSGNIEIY